MEASSYPAPPAPAAQEASQASQGPSQASQAPQATEAPQEPSQAPQKAQSPRARYADWPQKGDERAQPWDLDAVGIPKGDRDLEEGKPNTISPVVIRHSYPTVTFGAAGAVVHELVRRLDTLGYPTARDAFGVLTNEVMAAVERFREDFGVQEDPTPHGGNTQSGRANAARHIGPYTWEGILRASDRVLAELEHAS